MHRQPRFLLQHGLILIWAVLASCSLVSIPAPVPAAPKDLPPSYPSTIAQVSAYVTATMNAYQIEGLSIALIDHEDIVWAQGFGWADKASGRKVAPDTTFHIGSVSKMMPTTAAMILVDEGKLDLDRPVKDYVPAFSLLSAGYEQVTVRMLLNHQSGIPGALYNWALTTQPVTGYNQRLLGWLPGEYAQYPPGYFPVYCNNGFTLMEEVIAAASGRGFLDFVEERILEPLGMSSTGLDTASPEIMAHLSKPYINGVEMQPEYLDFLGTGGFTSTPSDLSRFLAMIAGGGTAFGQKILEPETVAMMGSDQTLAATVRLLDGIIMPGLGWDHFADPEMLYEGQAPTKGGDTALFGSQVLVLPDHHLAAAVTMNLRGSSIALSICEETLMAALEERYGLPRPTAFQIPPAGTPSFDTANLKGTYASTSFAGMLELQKVDSKTIRLLLTRGDSTTVIIGNLSFLTNGWFYSKNQPTYGFSVEQMDGRTALMLHLIGGATAETIVVGERLGTPPALSAAWNARRNTQWLVVDISPVTYGFDTYSPLVVLRERAGRLVYEYGVPGLAGVGHTALPSPEEDRIDRLLKSLSFKSTKATDGIPPTFFTQVIEPLNDDLAWTPLQLDCRDLTHMQVLDVSGEEWLRFGSTVSLLRPLATVPVLLPGSRRSVSLVPDRGEWFKLVDGNSPPSSVTVMADPDVRWGVYNDELRPIGTGWGTFHHAYDSTPVTACWYLYLGAMENRQAVISVQGPSSHANWEQMR